MPVPLARVWSPNTARFIRSGSLDNARAYYAVAALPDGRVLVTGGLNAGLVPKSSTRIWSSDTGQWAEVATMSLGRRAPVAVTLSDGRVLVAGGSTVSSDSTRSTEVYDPAADRWKTAGELPWDGDLTGGVALGSGGALVFGGSRATDGETVLAAAWSPGSRAWKNLTPPGALGSAVALPDGSALFFGSSALFVGGSRDVLRYSPDTGWSVIGRTLADRSAAAIAVRTDGRVLLAGGERHLGQPDATALTSVELFDPATGLSTELAPMPKARSRGAAIGLSSGRVLVAGGSLDAMDGSVPWCPTQAERAAIWSP